MAEVLVSTQAESDLDAVVEYYERVAPDLAAVFEEGLLAKLERLARFPRLRRIVPEIGDPDLREVVYRNHRVIYHVGPDDEVVDVLTLLHTSRQFGT